MNKRIKEITLAICIPEYFCNCEDVEGIYQSLLANKNEMMGYLDDLDPLYEHRDKSVEDVLACMDALARNVQSFINSKKL